VTILWGGLLRNWCLILGRDKGFFSSLSKAFKLAVGPIEPPMKFKCILGTISIGVKWPVFEAYHRLVPG
jgi:hypothetical protein